MFRQVSTIVIVLGFVGFVSSASLFGQVDDGGLGGPIDPGALENQIFDAVEQGGGAASSNTSGGFDDGGFSDGNEGFQFDDLFDFGNFGDASQGTTNQRDFPFVGVTVGEVPENYEAFRHIGAIRDTYGSSETGGRGTEGGGRGGAQGGPGSNQNGFEIQRPSIPVRSRILPRFNSRPIAPSFVSSQINQRFDPAVLRRSGVDANITVQGRTAVISGVAPSEQHARVLQRRLRLEPGISRVRSQMQVER